MKPIQISAESTIDLPKDLLSAYDIKTIPFILVLGEKEATDGEVDGDDLFAYVEKTGKLPHTSAINEKSYHDYFASLLEDAEKVIHFSLSSGITSATQNAILASQEFGGRVIVIDTHSLSTGIALQAIYASRLAKKGESAEEIVKKVMERLPYDQTSFALESVEYLYKGGRCSALARLGANLLHLRPQIIMHPDTGTMSAGRKFKGRMEKWVVDYIRTTHEEFPNIDPEIGFVTYSSADPSIIETAKKMMLDAGFKTVYVTKAGGTISCHCGPHCLGVLYFADGPHPVD